MKKLSPQAKMICTIIIAGIVIAAGVGWFVYRAMQEQAEERFSAVALTAAHMAAEIIDGDKIEDFLLNEARDSFLSTIRLLSELQQSNNLSFLYIVRLTDDGNIQYIFDIDPSLSLEQQIARLGETADVSAEVVDMNIFIEVYRTGQRLEEVIFTDTPQWGHQASAYVPIFSSDGRVVAIACADVDMNDVIQRVRQQTVAVLAIIFGAFLLSMLFTLLIYTKGLKKREAIDNDRKRVEGELRFAKDIHSRMIPSVSRPISDKTNYDIHACIDSKRKVGRDFYDVFFAGNDLLAVVIGTVLIGNTIEEEDSDNTAMLIRNSARMFIKINATAGGAPSKVFEAANDSLYEITEENVTITAFMGYLDLSSGEFAYVNAGHSNPLVKLEEASFSFIDSQPSFALASEKDIQFKEGKIRFGAGDFLFLHTSGIYKITNESTKLVDVANNYEGKSAEGLVKVMQDYLKQHTEIVHENQDMAMLALRFIDCD